VQNKYIFELGGNLEVRENGRICDPIVIVLVWKAWNKYDLEIDI
jgi:hypothetical protein